MKLQERSEDRQKIEVTKNICQHHTFNLLLFCGKVKYDLPKNISDMTTKLTVHGVY